MVGSEPLDVPKVIDDALIVGVTTNPALEISKSAVALTDA
jgi:hypothetical protein